LENLRIQFLKYFPVTERGDDTQDWITNAFIPPPSDLSPKLKENLLEMSVDGSLKIKFENMSICDFWIVVRKEFKELSDADISHLLPFPSTHLCEQGFFAVTSIKTKHKNRLNPVPALIIALTKIRPRTEVLAFHK
jgi:hypothetical protein